MSQTEVYPRSGKHSCTRDGVLISIKSETKKNTTGKCAKNNCWTVLNPDGRTARCTESGLSVPKTPEPPYPAANQEQFLYFQMVEAP